MSYLTNSLGFATRKINRKFNIKVRLYFNENSWNRDVDSTPRFWLDAQSIVNIEGLAFTERAMSKNKTYHRHGYRTYDNVGCPAITPAEVEAIFADLQKTFPYGFRENDSSSKQKYIADARNNDEFQGYWANYWKENSSKIVPLSGHTDHVYPYIEFQTSEHVATKHNIGTVPPVEGGSPEPAQAAEYGNSVIKNQVWKETLSDFKVLNVSINTGSYLDPLDQEELVFAVEGGEQKNLILDGEDQTAYALRFVDPWPTGVGGSYSGVAFRISETDDGENFEGTEYLDISAGSFTHETITHVVTISNSKFYLGGVEAPTLTMIRGSEYVFDVSDVSIADGDHSLFISTSATGGDNELSKHCHVQEIDSGAETVTFRVPFDAPNTLYYQCSAHTGMGNSISITSPNIDYPAVNANYLDVTPGDGLRVMLPSSTDDRTTFYYYGVLNANMGGAIFSRDCVIKCPGESPGQIGGIGTWDPTYY